MKNKTFLECFYIIDVVTQTVISDRSRLDMPIKANIMNQICKIVNYTIIFYILLCLIGCNST